MQIATRIAANQSGGDLLLSANRSPWSCAIGNRADQSHPNIRRFFKGFGPGTSFARKQPMKESAAFVGQAIRLEKPLHDQIAAIAFQLYVENGRQDGCDWEHWFRAEELLKEQAARSTRDQVVYSNRPKADRPLNSEVSPLAQDNRGTANRETRQRTIPVNAATRQSRRQPERSSQAL
jgi:hypothetical protein